MMKESVEELIEVVKAHLRAGRIADAEGICDALVRKAPQHHKPHGLLGLVAYRRGRFEEAVASLERAIALNPQGAEHYNNLGVVRIAQGMFREAEEAARKALSIHSGHAEAECNLGISLHAQGRQEEAERAYRRALAIRPDYVEAALKLAVMLHGQGRWEEAEQLYRKILSTRPLHAEAENNLGVALLSLGRPEEAERAYRRALAIRPGYAEAEYNLGNTLRLRGMQDAAIEAYRRALAIRPDYAEAEYNLADALRAQGQLGEAERAYRRALAIRPDYAKAKINLGGTLLAQGRVDEAIECFRHALDFQADLAPSIHSNLLFAEQYHPDVNLAGLAKAHADWNRRHAAPLKATWRPFENSRDPDRPLRLGFVSADFRHHPNSFFFVRTLEGLRGHDCETICYSDVAKEDAMTERIAAAAGTFCEADGLTDEELVEEIHADRIDILFDLTGHAAGHRLLAFARKPAPIQVSWIGYTGTTGLDAMDYLISDRFYIPPEKEGYYRERILRLPEFYSCYDPPADAPPVGPLPALKTGSMTLGSFSNPAKITPRVVETWAEILRRLPESRLVLKYQRFTDVDTQRRYSDLFAACGVDAARLEFPSGTSIARLLDYYGGIDLALDTFPYSGYTTTCEALWMGVPVVTCPGETFAGRHSLSLLANLGLAELIARDQPDYVGLALALAGDLPRLAALRAGLRRRMERSSLCDGAFMAARLMEALRVAWRDWCEDQ
jgi:protein O-GlcNAc transferase